MSKTSKELIHSSLTEIKKVFDADTEFFLRDVSEIEDINTNEALKSIKLEEGLNEMIEQSHRLKASNEFLANFDEKLSMLENQVDNLEAVANELDGWTKELAQKLAKK